MYTALTIAGSDSSGGAGIQADIKTMMAHGVYAMSAITALTAQNTTGVTDIMEVTPKFLAEQLDCIFTDIRPDAVKTGMVSSSELIEVIADKLKDFFSRFKKPGHDNSSFGGGSRESDWDYNARKNKEQEEIDHILDKIRKSGYDSLSEKEKRKLFENGKK